MISTALPGVAGAALLAALLAGLLAVAPASHSAPVSSTAPAAAPPAAPSSRTARRGACVFSPSTGPAVKDVGTPPAQPPYTSTVKATLTTGLGDIGLGLDGRAAPCTVDSFAYLATKDFFDRTSCHRLTTGALKVIQCGDPTATGSGGPGYQYDEENLPKADPGKETATYHKGTLAMANAGPGTNGSQFFMVYGDSELPPNYTVFGEITSGMDILEQVARAGTDNANGEGDGAPKKRLTLQDVTIAGSQAERL
ncbi:peptidylprolyl isomerase [Streptomyces racemochromogenes]|uniref:peptidylprolyl isomerase n=1 Tax=Streptomyces racemochromogenes TaxID=67353 RepID=UPI0035F0462A